MEYRTLGRTGIEVSTIGMGCWAIGGDAWGPVDDSESIAAIDRAVEQGVTLFDSADATGAAAARSSSDGRSRGGAIAS